MIEEGAAFALPSSNYKIQENYLCNDSHRPLRSVDDNTALQILSLFLIPFGDLPTRLPQDIKGNAHTPGIHRGP